MKLLLISLIAVLGFLVGCSGHSTTYTTSGSTCRARLVNNNYLPDPSCTPGSVNPVVNQSNIRSTICVTGWTKTQRPPASYTNKLKAQQIRAYGFTNTSLSAYEEDHLISLELGGNPTDPKNLWPEPGNSPNPKDRKEGDLKRLVCSGKLSLAQAQHIISTDWTKAP